MVFQAGGRAKEIRLQRKWTQAEVADRIGKSGSYVARIEKGRESPTVHTFFALVTEGLKVPLCEFFSPWANGYVNLHPKKKNGAKR